MTDLTIDGATFRVRIEGDAKRPRLMLSNSLGTDLSLWDAQMPALLKHFHVIRYDSRGHGGSVIPDGPLSIARLGRDALAILDALDVETTHFAGISLGGAVGQWLLIKVPGRIERAILSNTATRFGTPDGWNARIRSVLSEGMEANASATSERWFSADFSRREPDRVACILDVLRKTSAVGYAACCAALRDLDLCEGLRGVECPVLVVTGRQDPVISDADTARLLGAINGATHIALDTKHISNVEADAAFTEAMIGFLTAKMPARARAVAGKPAPRTARLTTRRSTAARSPLKTIAAAKPAKSKPTKGKPAETKTTARKPTPAKPKVASSRRSAAAKATAARSTVAAHKRTATKTPVAVKPATKKKTVKKALKTAAKRPLTKRSAARGAVKTITTKAKTKAVVKKGVKKAPLVKKLPTSRRKKPTKPRSPSGRRRT